MTPLIELVKSTSETIDYPPAAASLSITGITADSRRVQPGFLFVAIKGIQSDGTQFIAKAKEAGAVAVLCAHNSPPPAGEGIIILKTANPRLIMAQMAARFYNAQPKHMVAVTGTDGKTSTADFFRQLAHLCGHSSASIGTLGIISGGGELLYPDTRTTPEPGLLHWLLKDLADKNITHVCMEASSHGLDQYRMDGVKLEAAAFTNLTRDHMDYHHTEEAYFKAKLRLFADVLPEGKTAVLNQDDARFGDILAACKKKNHKVIGFGRSGEQFRLLSAEPLPHGQRAKLELFGKPYTIDVPLVGGFQVLNILTALGLVAACGGDLNKALAVIPMLTGVPGRLEQVAQLTNGATVFIDYAHTPAALEKILHTLRPHTKNKLHVVFGCGGDRDKGKRPEMGAVAERLADSVIITDDNPRSEDPASIRKAILAATRHAKEVADRREAIYVAIKGLRAGDILVIAGKGHEKTQTIGDKVTPFDDAEVARAAVGELKLGT